MEINNFHSGYENVSQDQTFSTIASRPYFPHGRYTCFKIFPHLVFIYEGVADPSQWINKPLVSVCVSVCV